MPGGGGGGMEGSGEGGRVALGWVLVSLGGERKERCEGGGGMRGYRRCISGRVVIG